MNGPQMTEDRPTSQNPKNQYGSLESVIRGIRSIRPMDLSHDNWRRAHPEESFDNWATIAREYFQASLNYDPGSLELNSKTVSTEDHGDFILEQIEFNTTPWHRLNGYFLYPKKRQGKIPGLAVLHAWGGPMMFGKDRIVNSGRDHYCLAEHREEYYDGKYLAEEYARNGYAVIVIDSHHFGERIPKGVDEIPIDFDPYSLSKEETLKFQQYLCDILYTSIKQLSWAGTTWAGLNYYDDSRCIDYMLSRPEVDPDRIGVTGLSGGAWRTNILAALDPRVKASVSVGWMTTGDSQQEYNIKGAIAPFCILPGVWNRMDVPDLALMAFHGAPMIVVGTHDHLFANEGVEAARTYIEQVAQEEDRPCRFYRPEAVHCYNGDVQTQAFDWFAEHLK
ncbi:hypothetical protein JYT61_00735 [bacterium AH-315-E10]|nr:hypothetical protein [bacterium AH-315-E10]